LLELVSDTAYIYELLFLISIKQRTTVTRMTTTTTIYQVEVLQAPPMRRSRTNLNSKHKPCSPKDYRARITQLLEFVVITLVLDLHCSVFCWAQSQSQTQQSQLPLDLDFDDKNDIIIINDDNNNDCYDDLYLSDENGDGKVDSEEYVDFSRRRLQYSQIEYEQEHEVENELELELILSEYGSFSQLPSVLQQNWFVLACLCSRYQFDNDNTSGDGNENEENKSCCVGDNAHLHVTTSGSTGGGESVTTEELMYSNLVCDFTQRAIDEIITNIIIEEIGVPLDDDDDDDENIFDQTDSNSNVNSEDEDDIEKIEAPSSSPSVATTTTIKDIPNLPTTSFPTKIPTLSPTGNLMTKAPTTEPTATLAIISTGSRPNLETTTSPTITPTSSSSPLSPVFFGLSIGIIVAIVVGGLLLIMILIQAIVLIVTRDYRRRRKYSTDRTEDDDDDEETGLPNALISSSNWKKEMTNNNACTTATPYTVNTGSIVEDQTLSSSIVQSNLGQQKQNKPNQQQVMKDQHGGNNSVPNSIPYVHTGSTIIPDDAKSTGCVSHESDSGWSEAYTSSIGSVSDNDDEMIPHHHHPGGFVSAKIADIDSNRSFSEGPVPSITTDEGVNINLKLSSTTNTMNNTDNTPTKMIMTTPDTTITTTTTPQSIALLDGASENDEIIVHEDISDEGDDDDGNDSNSNSNLNCNTRSPEEFRSKVYALIERVIPEETNQADDMIARFTDREDELIQTLLAMEIRASAQQQDRSSSSVT